MITLLAACAEQPVLAPGLIAADDLRYWASALRFAVGLVVRQQFVRTGRPLGDFISIVSGLKPGDTVASSGLFKLRNGVGVVVNNEIAPERSTTPHPPNG